MIVIKKSLTIFFVAYTPFNFKFFSVSVFLKPKYNLFHENFARFYKFVNILQKLLIYKKKLAGRGKSSGYFSSSSSGAYSPPLGQGLLIHEVSRSHTTTHHSR